MVQDLSDNPVVKRDFIKLKCNSFQFIIVSFCEFQGLKADQYKLGIKEIPSFSVSRYSTVKLVSIALEIKTMRFKVLPGQSTSYASCTSLSKVSELSKEQPRSSCDYMNYDQGNSVTAN